MLISALSELVELVSDRLELVVELVDAIGARVSVRFPILCVLADQRQIIGCKCLRQVESDMGQLSDRIDCFHIDGSC